MINWDQLSKIGNSRIVKLTILVPLFGYLILFNDSIVNYLTLSSNALQIGLETNPVDFTLSKLHFIYYGLTFLGIGSLIFSLTAPHEIKSFPNKNLFLSNSLKYITQTKIKEIQEALNRKPIPVFKFDKHLPTDTNSLWQNHNLDDIIVVLSLQYDELNSLSKYVRNIILFCYVAGGITLFIPSLSMFIKVTKIIFE